MKIKIETLAFILVATLTVYSLIITAKYQNTCETLNNRTKQNSVLVDSLNGVNAERQRQLLIIQKQLDDNYENYQSTLHSIDSLDRNGLRRQMRKLLTDITGQDSE